MGDWYAAIAARRVPQSLLDFNAEAVIRTHYTLHLRRPVLRDKLTVAKCRIAAKR
ncbi:MAG: hypothetical protein RI904_2784 [Pseudomonadota bacterium]